MAELKRDEIKYIRDLSKSSYTKDTKCYICGATEDLDFHHFSSLTLLWNKWKKDNDIQINSVEDIMIERENFKGYHFKEIYADTVTLCRFHHRDRLHKIYGKAPTLATAAKQKRWCEKQRIKFQEKLNGNTVKE